MLLTNLNEVGITDPTHIFYLNLLCHKPCIRRGTWSFPLIFMSSFHSLFYVLIPLDPSFIHIFYCRHFARFSPSGITEIRITRTLWCSVLWLSVALCVMTGLNRVLKIIWTWTVNIDLHYGELRWGWLTALLLFSKFAPSCQFCRFTSFFSPNFHSTIKSYDHKSVSSQFQQCRLFIISFGI